MYDTYVCPECGSAEFTQTRITAVAVTVNLLGSGHFNWDISDLYEDTLDGGDKDGDFTCVDCNAVYCAPMEDLITEDEYNAKEDDE